MMKIELENVWDYGTPEGYLDLTRELMLSKSKKSKRMKA
jgi:hypothetical protein